MKMSTIILIGLLLLGAVNLSYGQYLNKLADIDSGQEWGWNVFANPDNTFIVLAATQNVTDRVYSNMYLHFNADASVLLNRKMIRFDSSAIGQGNPGEAKRLPSGEIIAPALVQKMVDDTLRSVAGLMKFNNAGDTVFLKVTGDISKQFNCMLCSSFLSDGSYMAGGLQGKNIPAPYPGLIMRFKPNGDTLWTKTYRKLSARSTQVLTISPLEGGKIILGASSFYTVYNTWSSYSHATPWFITIDTLGNILKDTLYDDLYAGGGRIYNDSHGGFFHYGYIDTLQTPYPDDYENLPYYFAHLDDDLRITWILRFPYGPDGKHYIEKAMQLRDGNYLLFGESQVHNIPHTFGWVAKVSAAGQVLWSKNYRNDSLWDAYIRDAAERPDGSLVLVGASFNSSLPAWHSYWDMWILGIDSNGCEDINCTLITSGLADDTADFSMFPNPAADELNIRSGAYGALHLYNLTGQQVAVYAIRPGTNQLFLPATLTAGIYFCRYRAETGQTVEKKLVLLR